MIFKPGDRVEVTWADWKGRQATVVGKYHTTEGYYGGAYEIRMDQVVTGHPLVVIFHVDNLRLITPQSPFEQSLHSYIQQELG